MLREGTLMEEAIARAATTRAAVYVCRIALAHGPLVREGRHWRYRRRLFSNATVKQLLIEGAAVRVGDTVRSAVSAR